MDDDGGLNMCNWGGYYEPFKAQHEPFKAQHEPFKGQLGLQLMSSVAEGGNTRPFLPGRENSLGINSNGTYHPPDCGISEAPMPMEYARGSWIYHRDKFPPMFPGNPYNAVLREPSGSHSTQMLQPSDLSKDTRVALEEPSVKKENGSMKRTGIASPKAPKAKKSKKGPAVPKGNGNTSVHRTKQTKKSVDVVINGINMDISGIPVPVCSCTGSPQQCYRWGCGGWQSACCTTTISMYPLPMSTKRRGARIAGRKMSQGAFKKVLEKLAAEGYNFANPIDLRTHWAKHGTNKFVTIR